MILADNETRVDLLNNEAIAATIIKLLGEHRAEPVTIGVHGDWGAGKSSILEMIEAALERDGKVVCLKFNGWRFQGFEDAKIALIEGIVSALIEKRPALTKAAGALKNVLRRIDWLKVAKHAGGLAFTAFTGVPTPDQVRAIVGGLEAMVADPAKLATKENLDAAISGVKSVLKSDGETKSVPEEIAEFRKAFDQLLKDAGVEQLIVLVDDLDRCLPDIAIETLEAIRLFVFTSRTAFVVAADEAMIEYAVRKHFPDLPDTTGPRDYARNYLEKLIQVPFRIPALGEPETRIYVTLLLVGSQLGPDDQGYKKLIEAAREKLKRPWDSKPLDHDAIRVALGDAAREAQNALTLSDQIGPILAGGVKGNPRQIKRFLNTLLLRHRMADARGFGEEVRLPVLAKLMLAERFLPRLFDQIAVASAAHKKGICEDIAALEAASEDKKPAESAAPPRHAGAQKKPAPSKEAAQPEIRAEAAQSALLMEWLASQPIRDWARVAPSLADVDLRPYLFVTKDRKDYFGAVSALGHLASVVEQLLGPKIIVQTMDAELKRLAPLEAAQVFDALRGRIIGGDAFDTIPAGIAGLQVLVRAHPDLQEKLVDMLEALPPDRCGAWPVSGWEGVIVSPSATTRLTNLVESWAASAKSPALKATATSALKVRIRRA